MDLREVRMVRFHRCGSRLTKSNAAKVHRRSQPQVVYIYPVHVLRLELGGRGHVLGPQRIRVDSEELCAFLWSGVATSVLY